MAGLDCEAIRSRYRFVRRRTEALAAPLSAEDAMVQSMPDASPTKWHLAHTTWFFEEFVLGPAGVRSTQDDELWRVLFNSYYEAAGPRHPRAARGALSRPSLDAVLSWRSRVDGAIEDLLSIADEATLGATLLGTHHEEQHQELLLTDVKHALFGNPLRPAYSASQPAGAACAPGTPPMAYGDHEEVVADMGAPPTGFAFDNERPRSKVIVPPFRLASRLVTNAEYAAFIDDRGYQRAELWLSDGWASVQSNGWCAPLYWEQDGGGWSTFGMGGTQPLDLSAAVAHVSYYEADAYARWAGARLPTEFEWESVAAPLTVEGTFLESSRLAPAASPDGVGPHQMFGDAWEWTGSAYRPYARFRPLAGALGEYNGKFMSGQMVLRGGSCFSPQGHLRASYRNYFPPGARWQVTGIRLAKDA
jgi:ergothioneine biosynthesis protein EgtB